MSTANSNTENYSLQDIMASKDPDGKLSAVVDIITKSNPIMQDIMWQEGLLEEGDRVTLRTKLGNPQWKRYNQYASASTSKVTQVDEVCGHVEDWSQIDADLARKAGDLNAFLMRESKAKIAAMGQAVVETMLYGNLSTDPATFQGFLPRLGGLNEEYMSGEPVVIDAGGRNAAGNASILLVGWGTDTVHGIFPKYSKAGLDFQNKGLVTDVKDGKFLDVYRSKFSWEAGLAVRDYRYIVRIANIDVASLAKIGDADDASAQLYLKFIDAISAIPNPDAVKLCAYGPRKVWAALSKKAALTGNRDNSQSITQVGMVSDIMGVPFRRLDSMLTAEAVIA